MREALNIITSEKVTSDSLAGMTARKWRSRDDQGPATEIAAMAGTDVLTYTRERPAMSAFVLEDGIVYHTYSTYA